MQRNRSKSKFVALGVLVAALLLLSSVGGSGQKLAKSMTIQAQAMGQAQQLGRSANVTIIIEEWSPASDQQGLMEAFTAKGNEGLINALNKMHSKGRMQVTGTLGYDISYARKFAMPDGTTKIRVVTNRPLRFGEVWSDSRSSDYQLSAIELILDPKDKKKSSGTLLPAAELKLNKENQIEIETFQNPWKLVNVMVR